jgi:hypothetical protein
VLAQKKILQRASTVAAEVLRNDHPKPTERVIYREPTLVRTAMSQTRFLNRFRYPIALVAFAAIALVTAPHALPHLPDILLSRRPVSLRPKEVYATFLQSEGPLSGAYPDRARFETVEDDDHYFNSILLMAHALRWQEVTRDRQQRELLVKPCSNCQPRSLRREAGPASTNSAPFKGAGTSTVGRDSRASGSHPAALRHRPL